MLPREPGAVVLVCAACDRLEGDARSECYASGCCCFGPTCYEAGCCSGELREAKRASYGCESMDTPIVLPASSLVGLSVYDLDSGAVGEAVRSAGLCAAGFEA